MANSAESTPLMLVVSCIKAHTCAATQLTSAPPSPPIYCLS